MTKVCCYSVITVQTMLQFLHLDYRFFDVQFSSNVANVLRANRPISNSKADTTAY